MYLYVWTKRCIILLSSVKSMFSLIVIPAILWIFMFVYVRQWICLYVRSTSYSHINIYRYMANGSIMYNVYIMMAIVYNGILNVLHHFMVMRWSHHFLVAASLFRWISAKKRHLFAHYKQSALVWIWHSVVFSIILCTEYVHFMLHQMTWLWINYIYKDIYRVFCV